MKWMHTVEAQQVVVIILLSIDDLMHPSPSSAASSLAQGHAWCNTVAPGLAQGPEHRGSSRKVLTMQPIYSTKCILL